MKSFPKIKKSKKESSETSTVRITNETVAEHREKVLAGGRKFKYPVQYQKHKLVINSIIISVVAIVFLTILGWYQLYVSQGTGSLIYRLTQIVPVSVASVDGETVRYSDYLMRARGAMYYAQKKEGANFNTDDGKCQEAYYKRKELNIVERSAFVSKLARELKLSVSDKEVDDSINKFVEADSVSLNAYEKTVLRDHFGWSLDEHKTNVRNELLEKKVIFAVDSEAKNRAEQILNKVKGGADFSATATAESDDDTTKASGGDSGVLSVKSLDPDGLIAAARSLEPNKTSDLIQGVDSYYIIQLTSKDDNTVRYKMIKIKLKVLDQRFEDLKKQGKIKEYIKVDRPGCSAPEGA